MPGYQEAYRRSMEDPEGFWGDEAGRVDWTRQPTTVLDRDATPVPRWYVDGELNTCANAVDRHVDGGRGEQRALVYDSPVTGTQRSLSFRELRDETARVGGMLRELGVGVGDRVVIYMPMVPEAVVAMLACARIGAVHSVVFGGFAAPELAVRVDDAEPVVVLAASCGVEAARVVEYGPLLTAALEQAEHTPAAVVVLQREQAQADVPGALDWAGLVAQAQPVDPVPVTATDPLYVLYTSGTTGGPKGVVRDNGGHAVAMAYSMEQVYGLAPGDVFWAASDIGWVVGHSYIVYGPLIAGCTSVLYEGKPVGTPDAGAFWRVIADHGVNALLCAPTAVRAVRRQDPEGELVKEHDISSLRTLFCAGERLDPETYEWAGRVLDRPVVDNWWQTETGWPIASNMRGLEPMPLKPGSPSVPVPGYDVRIVDEAGADLPRGQEGSILLRLPMPPGCLPTLWGDDQRMADSYLTAFPGSYLSGDGGYLDEDGYLYVLGRTDDVINVAGHRLSTGSMEAVVAAHPDVSESAVVGVEDETKGQVPQGFVVLKAGVERDGEELQAELVAAVRDAIGPVAAFRRVDVVASLPKTRSGKVLRRSLRDVVSGSDAAPPPTIEDPAVLDAIREQVRSGEDA